MLSQLFQSSVAFFQIYGTVGLFLMSFAESSFFPVPPDILLIAMSLSQPKLALWYALITSVASVLGGIFGYFIGAKAGRPLLDRWVPAKRVAQIESLFQRYGGWATCALPISPIPYKVFTIGAGVFQIQKTVFVVASILSRSARFFLEGLLIFYLGSAAKHFLSSYLEILTIGLSLVILLLYFVLRHTKTMQYLNGFWVKLRERLERYYNEKMSPLGAFGNYLLVGSVLGIGSMLLFAKLASELLENELKWFDNAVIDLVHRLDSPLTTEVMKGLSTIGSSTVMIGVALVAALLLWWVKRHFWDALMVPVALIGSYSLNELLKWIFRRDRPNVARLVEATGYSFPSGHAMVSMTVFGLLAYLAWINLRQPLLRYLLTCTLVLLAVAIGISRIYLGVHYPSDVLAGFAAGGFWLVGCILGLQAIRYYKADADKG
ncbi:MAG: phosphatase PAP2 family protein [Firmicutes bacterium]|nr:phosphatase PAP2 family protein [Bacillota bacterium]